MGGKPQRCMSRGIGARASTAVASCARTHLAPSLTRSRRRARLLRYRLHQLQRACRLAPLTALGDRVACPTAECQQLARGLPQM